MKKIVAFAGFSLLAVGAFAQTNLQVFYDFGENRKYTTTTLEMFKSDNWGSTVNTRISLVQQALIWRLSVP